MAEGLRPEGTDVIFKEALSPVCGSFPGNTINKLSKERKGKNSFPHRICYLGLKKVTIRDSIAGTAHAKHLNLLNFFPTKLVQTRFPLRYEKLRTERLHFLQVEKLDNFIKSIVMNFIGLEELFISSKHNTDLYTCLLKKELAKSSLQEV